MAAIEPEILKINGINLTLYDKNSDSKNET
jgi:hypothetical protein